jgi:hypothetical protein
VRLAEILDKLAATTRLLTRRLTQKRRCLVLHLAGFSKDLAYQRRLATRLVNRVSRETLRLELAVLVLAMVRSGPL